ncbi:MAG: MBG domain-containing protein, partial [bacterium]
TGGSGSVTITAKALTITATAQSKVYGTLLSGTAGYTNFTQVGLVNSDAITSVTVAYANGGNLATNGVGPYLGTITITGATGEGFTPGNYAITYVPATLTVTTKDVTIHATRAYDGALNVVAAIFYTISGTVGGETLGVSGFGTIETAGIGTGKDVTKNTLALVDGTGGSAGSAANYNLASATADITTRALTVTANAHAMQVGNALPTLTYTPGLTLVNGDVLTGSLVCTNTGAVGVYPIAQGDLSAGANYTLTYVGATLVIVNINHTGVNFHSPGTAASMKVEFSYPTNGALTNLTWTPSLPTGWVLSTASNAVGSLSVVNGGVVLSSTTNLGANPQTFWFAATVPGNQASIVAFTNASVSFAFTPVVGSAMNTLGMANEANSWRFHSADYEQSKNSKTGAPIGTSDWVIDVTELNRVLAYWRASGYHLSAAGYDGYAQGFVENSVTGAYHSADYGHAGTITADQAARVISYWRAGAYQVCSTGLDGYASYSSGQLQPLGMGDTPAFTSATVTQSGPSRYDAGGTLTINCTMNYSGRLLATTWKPVLPAGWKILAVSGMGTPVLLHGEVLFTSQDELPNPLVFAYTVQAPISAIGTVSLDCEAHPMLQGLVNPLIVAASQGLQMAPNLDTNGLGSGWENAYGIAAGTDASTMGANGYTLAQSYLGGFNPNDVNSVLVIQSFDLANGQINLSWPSVESRTYTVEAAQTPAGPYVPVATGIPAAGTQTSRKLEVGSCGPFIRLVVD